MPRRHRPGAAGFVGYHEAAITHLKALGLSPALINALRPYGLLATDAVTGFHEGRFGEARVVTLRRVLQHVRRTSNPVFYVEMDVANLGGFNAALGHSGANRVYAAIAAVVRRCLTEAAGTAVFFRHGGDEVSAFLVDAPERPVRTAMAAVRAEVRELARCRGLADLPHPKYPSDHTRRGVSIHFGLCRLTVAHLADPAGVFREADTRLEAERAIGPHRAHGQNIATELQEKLARRTSAARRVG